MVEKRKLIYLFAEISMLFVYLMLIFIQQNGDFIYWSRVSFLFALIAVLPIIIYQKKILSATILFYTTFTLFQLGLPILYAVLPTFNNYYIGLFSQDILKEAVKYSTLSNIIAATAILHAVSVKKNLNVRLLNKWSTLFEKNSKAVAKWAFFLFIATGCIVLPITGFAVLNQLSSGIFSIAYRTVMAENGLLRFAQEFFYSSALVVICFDEKGIRKKIAICGYVLACLIMILLADRAQGLVGLFVLGFFYYKKADKARGRLFRNVFFLIFGLFIVFIMVYIANARGGSTNASSNFIFSFISELGFNFTSICFVMELIPSHFSYWFGSSYIAAFVRLIPSSLDFLGITGSDVFELGEMWLYHYNERYRPFLNFGVGFSLNAESYMNFSWFGVIAIYIIVFYVTRLLADRKANKWETYVQLILLLDLLLLPRRQFYTFVKSIEYSLFFMGLFLYIFIARKKK